MILTKDNLLRFVREKKYTTPTKVAEAFDTSTMIASAALSEIVKDKSIALTNLKIGSTPYYYDLRQKDCLIPLGESSLSGFDKDAFLKLRESQVVNDTSLSIQVRLAMERIKDFAIPIEINYDSKEFKFWIWYMLDVTEVKKQLNEALKQRSQKPAQTVSEKQVEKREEPQKQQIEQRTILKPQTIQNNESDEQQKIDMYLRERGFWVESKEKQEKGYLYTAKIKVSDIDIHFDCFFFNKKPTDSEIISFYTSSMRPKILFIRNPPKKFYILAENLDNCIVVNV